MKKCSISRRKCSISSKGKHCLNKECSENANSAGNAAFPAGNAVFPRKAMLQ
jgi:hypothetical protein